MKKKPYWMLQDALQKIQGELAGIDDDALTKAERKIAKLAEWALEAPKVREEPCQLSQT